jgi:hypothetical protein
MLAAEDQIGSRVVGIVSIGLAVLEFLVLILPGIIAVNKKHHK